MIRRLWRDQRLAFLAFLAALIVTLVLLGRVAVIAVFWANPANRDVVIKAWMTPGYVARSYRVAPSVVFEAIPYAPIPGDPRTIAQIATETGRSADDITATLQAAILAKRAQTAPASTP
ncbi:MAG: hypothetical protein ACK4GO_02035 [Gemmobacter sp.]